jgi:hypothetical protein
MGNHTLSHPCTGNFPWSRAHALEDYTLERMDEELAVANAEIQRLTGRTPQTFGYPCGQKYVGRGVDLQSYIPLIARRFAAGRGFRDEAINDPVFCDPAQLSGIDFDTLTFAECLVWVERAVREGGWLVFAGHDVGDSGFQVVRRDTLDALCAYCRDPANGVWIDTVAAVANAVRR